MLYFDIFGVDEKEKVVLNYTMTAADLPYLDFLDQLLEKEAAARYQRTKEAMERLSAKKKDEK